MKCFLVSTESVLVYRSGIIKKIKKIYTPEEFYFNEQILNILFWRLKIKLRKFVGGSLVRYLQGNPYDGNYHASSINTSSSYNEKNGEYYNADPNKLDIICMNLMTSRKKYEYFYNNSKKINDYTEKYESNNYYYKMNYPFPNATPAFFNTNSKKYWIKKMYFTNERDLNAYNYPVYQDMPKNVGDKYWYELIKP